VNDEPEYAYKDLPILILDEATAMFDPDGGEGFYRRMS